MEETQLLLLLFNLLSAVHVIAPTEYLLSTCNCCFALLFLNRSIVGDEEICLADEAECIRWRSYTTLAAVAAQKRPCELFLWFTSRPARCFRVL